MKWFVFLVCLILQTNTARAVEIPVNDLQGMLANAKFTGLCGAVQEMLFFQRNTQTAGGEDFIYNFVGAEAKRLGLTHDSFLEQCEMSIRNYDEVYHSVE